MSRVENINWHAEIHDINQIELNVDYKIQADPEQDLLIKNLGESLFKSNSQVNRRNFEFDFYLFTPRSLPISSESFSKEQTARMIKNFMRLHTPYIEACKYCKLQYTDEYLQLGVNILERKKIEKKAVFEVKMFANYVIQQQKKISMLQRNKDVVGEDILIQVGSLKKLIDRFRVKYMNPIRENKILFSVNIVDAFFLADEYISNGVLSLYILLRHQHRLLITCFIEEEQNYRYEYFARYNIVHNQKDRERYFHRRSFLKKYISRSLFLHLKTINRDNLFKNIFAAFAAALAAIFANLTRVDNFQGAEDFGARFFILFGLAVIAYVFKDRVKDLTKEYLNQWFSSRFAGKETQVLFKRPAENDGIYEHEVGSYREQVRFTKIKDIPDVISYIKGVIDKQDGIPTIGGGVIHYRKLFSMNRSCVDTLSDSSLEIKDVFRFNIADFLALLGNPSRQVAYHDHELEVVSVDAPKNYYFDLIVRVSESDHAASTSQNEISALRIVTNKKGLVRIEPLLKSKKFYYAQEINE